MLIVPLLSYFTSGWMIGWASAPIDVAWAARFPRRIVVVALAGPLANLALAGIAWVGLRAGLTAQAFIPSDNANLSEVVLAAEPGLAHLAALLLSLCDVDTPLWLSPEAHGAAAYLRFHCGAPITFEPAAAGFALVTEPARDGGKVVTGRKGVGRFDAHVEGRPAHSGSRHQDGRSAIREAARQVLSIEAMTDYGRGVTTTGDWPEFAGGTTAGPPPVSTRRRPTCIFLRAPSGRTPGTLAEPVHHNRRLRILNSGNSQCECAAWYLAFGFGTR